MRNLKLFLIGILPFALVWFWAWVFTHDLHSAYSLAAAISCTFTVAIAVIVAIWYVMDNWKEGE
jgi:hypothetical protein